MSDRYRFPNRRRCGKSHGDVVLRYCECGRELEKWCRLCSECRAVNDQMSKDIYIQSKKGVEAQDKYNKSEKGKITRRRADKKWREENQDIKQEWKDENKKHIKEYNKKYYQRRKQCNTSL